MKPKIMHKILNEKIKINKIQQISSYRVKFCTKYVFYTVNIFIDKIFK